MPPSHRAAILAVFLLPFAAPRTAGADERGWRVEDPLGDVPLSRISASSIYDPNRDRMVVWGGYAYGAPQRGSWLLSLRGRPKWTEMYVEGEPPPGSWDHSAVYDAKRDRVLVFGGVGAAGDSTQDETGVWVLGLASASWESLTVNGPEPPPRDSHSAIYVPTSDEMILFGGGGDGGLLDDAWALSLGADPPQWNLIQAAGTPPPPRARHSAIYDPVGNQMVIFGGASYFGEMTNDVWTLSLGSSPMWSQLQPSGAPPSPRAGHRAVYDPVRHSMLVFGGYQGGDEPYGSDLWELTLGGAPEWRQIATFGVSPGGRFAPDLVFDVRKQRIVLCGGAERAEGVDVWSFGSTVRGNDEPESFSIGPNPFKAGGRSLTFFVPAAGMVTFEAMDIAGRRLWKREMGHVEAGWHSTPFDPGLTPGLYWIRALQNGRTSSARLTVVR